MFLRRYSQRHGSNILRLAGRIPIHFPLSETSLTNIATVYGSVDFIVHLAAPEAERLLEQVRHIYGSGKTIGAETATDSVLDRSTA
jgi:quinolinate synthase